MTPIRNAGTNAVTAATEVIKPPRFGLHLLTAFTVWVKTPKAAIRLIAREVGLSLLVRELGPDHRADGIVGGAIRLMRAASAVGAEHR